MYWSGYPTLKFTHFEGRANEMKILTLLVKNYKLSQDGTEIIQGFLEDHSLLVPDTQSLLGFKLWRTVIKVE